MKEEKKSVEAVETVAVEEKNVEQVVATSQQERVVPRYMNQNDAIRSSIRDGRSFELFRLVKKYRNPESGRETYFYDYVVCIVLGGIVPFKFIHVKPFSEYISRKATVTKSQQNSVSYVQLNFMFDLGLGLSLVCREDTSGDNYDRNYPRFRFYAVATDESGLTAEFELEPNTTGDRQFLLSAFAGFGKCRSATWNDINSDNPKGIKNAIMSRYLGPGESPNMEVSDEVI